MINIGSVVSGTTPPMSVVYMATKSAVDGVTRVLAKELAPRKIRVNSINPGSVETEGTPHSWGAVHSPATLSPGVLRRPTPGRVFLAGMVLLREGRETARDSG